MLRPIRFPECLRWHLRAIHAAWFGPLLLVLPYVLALGAFRPRWFVFLAMACVAALSVAAGEWIRRDALRICRRAGERGGKMCSHCRFDLTKLAEVGQCPECGRWYIADDLRGVWLEAQVWLERRWKRKGDQR